MLNRRHRHLSVDGEEPAIPLSPLIDCVFLLLIFFLVTTMLKRKESIIPVVMPDATSSLSENAREDVLVVGLDREGRFLEPTGRDKYGALAYRQQGSLGDFLDQLILRDGAAATAQPLRLDVDRMTPFQKTIDAIDAAKLKGFQQVTVKIRRPVEE